MAGIQLMDLTNNTFSRKKSIPSKLISFGFECHDAIYRYQTMLAESKFLLTVVIDQEGSISSELLDPSTNEPYTLHYTPFGKIFQGVNNENYVKSSVNIMDGLRQTNPEKMIKEVLLWQLY